MAPEARVTAAWISNLYDMWCMVGMYRGQEELEDKIIVAPSYFRLCVCVHLCVCTFGGRREPRSCVIKQASWRMSIHYVRGTLWSTAIDLNKTPRGLLFTINVRFCLVSVSTCRNTFHVDLGLCRRSRQSRRIWIVEKKARNNICKRYILLDIRSFA